MTRHFRQHTMTTLFRQPFAQRVLVALILAFLVAVILYCVPHVQKTWHNNNHSAADHEQASALLPHYSNTAASAMPINPHCRAFFSFEANVNRQFMSGGVFWQGLGKQPKGNAFALHVTTEQPLTSAFAPFIIYLNDFGTYLQSDLPPALEEQSRQHLLAFFYAMQWSRENPTTEQDAMGEYRVRYTDNQRKKGAYLNNNPVQTLHYSSQVSLTPESCYWDALETQEYLSITLAELGHRVRLNNHTAFALSEPTQPTPFWLSGSYERALIHVQQYQPNIKATQLKLPSDAELMALLNRSTRAQARNVILTLLDHDNFVQDLVAKLQANRSELSGTMIARIIALMSVKDTELTQNAVLDLLNHDGVHQQHRFQAAVALGDFHHLYNADLAANALAQFNQTVHPAIFRSALISSLGRFAANIRHQKPQVYQHIVQQLFDELGSSNVSPEAQAINESGMLLDSIYNAKVTTPELLTQIKPFSDSPNRKNRERAAAIYAAAKRHDDLGRIITGEHNPASQVAMLNTSRVNRADIEEYVSSLLVSEHAQVRTESLRYLADRQSLSAATETLLLNQFHSDSLAKNRALIANIFQRNNKLHLLNEPTP